MRPRREAGRVRADTAPAPRRAEARSGSGRAAAARKESPSPVVWCGGVERWTGGEGLGGGWCGDENGSKGGADSGTGNREDAFGSPQSEKDGPADAAAEAFYNSCARPICTAEDQQQITDKKASSIRALNFQVAAATAIAHVGLSDYAL